MSRPGRLTRKKAIAAAVAAAIAAEQRRCAEVARKPYETLRVHHHDPIAWSSGYLQASDDIRRRILSSR